MVRLLVMQFDTDVFGIFARIGFMAGDMFISHESVNLASAITKDGLDKLMSRFIDNPVVEIGDVEFPIDLTVYDNGRC